MPAAKLAALAARRWLLACTLGQFKGRPFLPVRIAGLDLILVRRGAGIRAVERVCPHGQADLALGHCRDGRLHCPRHRASFDLDDGHISPGWDSRPLRLYPVRIRGEAVLVDVRA